MSDGNPSQPLLRATILEKWISTALGGAFIVAIGACRWCLHVYCVYKSTPCLFSSSSSLAYLNEGERLLGSILEQLDAVGCRLLVSGVAGEIRNL